LMWVVPIPCVGELTLPEWVLGKALVVMDGRERPSPFPVCPLPCGDPRTARRMPLADSPEAVGANSEEAAGRFERLAMGGVA
jgi:hypothetical protein